MPWSTSDRRTRLPSDWKARVAAVRDRAGGRCQAATHVPECNGIGTDCDHIARGDDHSLNNLQWLSRPCHKAKTTTEAVDAQFRRRRPAETHPGSIGAAAHPLGGSPRPPGAGARSV